MEQQLINNRERQVEKLLRSPTLVTVKMVEKTIEKYSGEIKKTQIWKKLPRKVMWNTYLVVLDYLEEINKIVISDDGIITYIWNPQLARKMKSRKSY